MKKEKVLTTSNILSFLRLLLAIPIWILLGNLSTSAEQTSSINIRFIVLGICLVMMLTDFLDGYFARKRNEITEIGKVIDPLADKIGVGVIVLRLFLLELLPAYYFWIVVLRDVIILIGGIYVTSKIGKVLPSNYVGKVTVTIISIVMVLAIVGIQQDNLIYLIFYYTSIVLIFVSLITYIIRATEYLKKNNYGTI